MDEREGEGRMDELEGEGRMDGLEGEGRMDELEGEGRMDVIEEEGRKERRMKDELHVERMHWTDKYTWFSSYISGFWEYSHIF